MCDLLICRICLRVDVKMYRLDRFQLKSFYEEVTASKVNMEDGLPKYFCYECAMMLNNYHKFKEKCYCGMKAFKELKWKGAVTYDRVSTLDRKSLNLMPILGVIRHMTRSVICKVQGTDPEETKPDCIKEEVETMEIMGEVATTVEIDLMDSQSPLANENDVQEFIKIKKEDVEPTTIKKEQKSPLKVYRTKPRSRFLDSNNWKKSILDEGLALKQFKERTTDQKYLRASFKCTDCYKGFSKQDMLNRHFKLRHSLSLGIYECRFCKMRFKWESHLRIHIRQHFTKYQCLRCDYVCNLENSAFLHEEFHSGVLRKCIHCDYEFKHASTYYTHLRTVHRTLYICRYCGVSFVSEAGLHQHKKLKHNDELDYDDDDDGETYCERCDIQFDSQKAFIEHLFHSLLHADGLEGELRDEITIPRKLNNKRLKDKVSEEYRNKNVEFPSTVNRKRRKRARRKPTTCHHCGLFFDTQSACMKHHLKEHPGTSFYADSERHICEICGASLAPGSVAIHQNMHTKEKVYPCETCGREFHSTIGLKRHQVTHTGEKRYGCALCEKRFTQSNSMKLHYRTFHLKEPYPKRNRKKREAQESVGSYEEERSELDSLPEQDLEPLQPQEIIIEERVDCGDVEYLTLD